MTRRERLERKLELREEWASKARARSDAAFEGARRIADGIPFGQPILVGHHSERHARRDQDRIHRGMQRGCEQADLAKHHASKADGLARQLDTSIFSDDPDAVKQIEARIAEREAKRERMKRINALYRKGDAEKLRAEFGIDYEALRAKLEAPGVYSWCRIPYAAYELSNLGNRIRADKERLKAIRARQERAPGGGQPGAGGGHRRQPRVRRELKGETRC